VSVDDDDDTGGYIQTRIYFPKKNLSLLLFLSVLLLEVKKKVCRYQKEGVSALQTPFL